ncbi:hypothetical protein [Nonomuraea sp. KM90]|uniref:hypothetical protein n=1 Tax=Nonomuraea sp. KM90 TaxID=3457428 RepID=UPI003FCCC590
MPPKATPEIDKVAGQAAIQRVIARRRQACDPRVDELEHDDPFEHPLPVVQHVLQIRPLHLVTDDDVIDALWILAYIKVCGVPHVPAAVDQLENELLLLGRRLRIPQIRMAPTLGAKTPQAVDHRIKRARAKKLGLPASERAERDYRLRGIKGTQVGRKEAIWYRRHGLQLWDVAQALVKLRGEHDELIDDELAQTIVDIARELRRKVLPVTPTSYPVLRDLATVMYLFVEEVQDNKYDEFRAKGGSLFAELAKLAHGQHAARFGS